MKHGRKGGRQAARALKRAVEDFIESDARSIAKNSKIIVRAYANCYGLESHLNFGKDKSEFIDLQEFVRGLNQGESLFEFIDVGDGKERTDIKLKGGWLSPGSCHD